MTAAGYAFTGSWAWGENIAWATTRSPAGLQDEVLLLHTNLMNSSGHRANILNNNYREVGSSNVKLDLIDPATGGGSEPPPPPPPSGVIVGTASSETLNGTSGADTIQGLAGDDRLYGREGNDRLEGGSGRDYLFGSSGDDTLLGGGNDYLYGGSGRDVLTGGANRDSFVFDTSLGASNIDRITDFSVADDTIRHDHAVFTAFGWNGTMSSSAFYAGAAAHDSTTGSSTTAPPARSATIGTERARRPRYSSRNPRPGWRSPTRIS